MKGILYLEVVWTVAMMFVFAFMCGASSPWEIVGHSCPGWYTRWVVLGVTGCCFEVAIALVAVWNVWGLQTTLLKKAVVVSLFACRLPMIIIVAAQLSIFHQSAFTADPTLHATYFICVTELALSYSICAANFPAFRRLTSDIRTDFGGFGTVASIHTSQMKPSSGYIRSGRSNGGQDADTFPIAIGSSQSRPARVRESGIFDVTGQEAHGVGYSVEARHGDNISLSSNAISEHESEDMIIRTRRDITVTRDD